MKTLTVFTPTYNRKHTLPRTYESLCRQTCRDFDWLVVDDGSSDGTREWIESLGQKATSSGQQFDWMGRIVSSLDANDREAGRKSDVNTSDHFIVQTPNVRIEYIYKPNGGLYTGYNVAYQTIETELCVCIDSDDYMPDDAVEKIVGKWSGQSEEEKKKYCGITGLDFNVVDKKPIGGYFPDGIESIWFNDLRLKNLHVGDTKQVMRTVLMRDVAPMEGFEGERNFNPIYMLIQVLDKYPVLLLNDNLCWVEYQIGADSMSQGIFKQYVNSPRSFAKMRKLEMCLEHNTMKDRIRSAIHYVSSCMIAKDRNWLQDSPEKMLTLMIAPLGMLLYIFIKYKTRKR